MLDEMHKQLGAYLDGELYGAALQAMQAHLETCRECREELDALRRLSEALRSASLPEGLPPADRFADQLIQQLPPRVAVRPAFPVSRAGWLVPVGLLAVLVFSQATGVLSTLASLASASGQLGDIGAWFGAGPGQTLWFSALQTILQNALDLKAIANLQVANDAVLGLQQWLINPLLWQSIVALAYLAGLAAWWFSRQASNPQAQELE
jgi:hypothetical protein